MKLVIVSFSILISLSTVYAQAPEIVEDENIEIVADQLYWWESEGNLGVSISAKFNSHEQMYESLSLTKKIGTFKSEEWVLGDILVSVDLNANGAVASWSVSGPEPLISEYLKDLEAGYKDRSLFYVFQYGHVNYKPTAYLGC